MQKLLTAEITILERIKDLLEERSVSTVAARDDAFNGFVTSLCDMVDEEALMIYEAHSGRQNGLLNALQ